MDKVRKAIAEIRKTVEDAIAAIRSVAKEATAALKSSSVGAASPKGRAGRVMFWMGVALVVAGVLVAISARRTESKNARAVSGEVV